MKEELTKNKEKVHKYRLHQILKRKIDKQRRESILSSSVHSEVNDMSQL